MLKRICSLFLAALLILTPSVTVNAANPEQNTNTQSIDSILSNFHRKSQELKNSGEMVALSNLDSSNDALRQETVNTLVEAGYESYNVTKDNFDAIEEALATDLNAIGLSEDCSYIVTVCSEAQGGMSAASAIGGSPGTSFSYASNGTTYTMRYLVVTAADVPAYGMASSANLLNSSTQAKIIECLNSTIEIINTLIDNEKLGLVLTILGLALSEIDTTETTTLYLHGGTNWTRVFTQVWDNYDEGWIFGSCVEYATATCYFSGQYYSSSLNRYVSVPSNEKIRTIYSSRFFDTTWRKQKAIEGITSITQYDLTGPVKYTYNDTVKITHQVNHY